MSLVEKVLEKMQRAEAAGKTASANARNATTFGAVVSTTDRHAGHGHAAAPIHSKIVEIDQNLLRQAGLLPPPHQERQIAKQYRQIKRPLMANASGPKRIRNGHVIMMASALQGEGKTFTCINLAFSLTLEKDVKVVLVDGDVAKPHISQLFGLQSEPGLLDVLRDPALSVETVILPTNVPGLYVLPAGTQSETATELISSARMQEVIASIGTFDSQRLVLFDSPPLLLTTESAALATVAGQIAMVVRAGSTSQQAVMDALSHLEGKSIGLILNQSKAEANATYYGYGNYGDAAKPREALD